MHEYMEPSRRLPVQTFDVVVCGGGTAGVVAAIASARQGARTALIESKGYVGGIVVEGGTALHSFYNLYKPYPDVEKKQIVKGIPQEIIDNLVKIGGSTGHVEMLSRYDYDSVCTAIDTELYKLVAFDMLTEAGVCLCMNTLVVGAVMEEGYAPGSDRANENVAGIAEHGRRIRGVITESRSGRELFEAKSFIDCTGYGDLSAFAGAAFTEPNDHPVANSMGVGGVSIDDYCAFMRAHGAVTDYSEGIRSGKDGQVVRVDCDPRKLPPEIAREAQEIGMAFVTTTVHDNYLMFIKLNYKTPESPTSRDQASLAEVALRHRQMKAIAFFRKHIPGCEHAFIARTSPSIAIRRGRCIVCDYDLSSADVEGCRHFEDDVFTYGFHDCAPSRQIGRGGTYGFPLRAMQVTGVTNLLASGMLITSDWHAHMSTWNTVSCMAQGQASGTAAAICAKADIPIRSMSYRVLREVLLEGDVHLEN